MKAFALLFIAFFITATQASAMIPFNQGNDDQIRKALVLALDGKKLECVDLVKNKEVAVTIDTAKRVILDSRRKLTINQDSQQPVILLEAQNYRLEITTSSDFIDIVRLADKRIQKVSTQVNNGTIINPKIETVVTEKITSNVSCDVLNI